MIVDFEGYHYTARARNDGTKIIIELDFKAQGKALEQLDKLKFYASLNKKLAITFRPSNGEMD